MQDANVVGTIPTPPYEYSAHSGAYSWPDFRLPSLTATTLPKQSMFEEAELFHSLCNSLHFAEDFKRTSQTTLVADSPVTSPEQPEREAQQRCGTTVASPGLAGDSAEWFQHRITRDPPLQGLVEETPSLVPGAGEKARQNSSSPSMYDEVGLAATTSCSPGTPGERRTSSESQAFSTEEHDEWAIEDVAVSAKGWPSASSPAAAATTADSAAGRESAERRRRNSGSLSGVSEGAAKQAAQVAAGLNGTSVSPNATEADVSTASTESLLVTVVAPPDLEEDAESETEEEQVLLPSGERSRFRCFLQTLVIATVGRVGAHAITQFVVQWPPQPKPPSSSQKEKRIEGKERGSIIGRASHVVSELNRESATGACV
ncbi:hypothetical protein HPB50_006001 [Hyalomma asiaticum]|uniref:Uncharacterized protein n=1 Tax=Hyalomma asiaticum TaxID=266040 RepID=A0ACB7S5F0_HYAAI|nr:hypothetical protein HPB50_006001 [Hyalomma asiaticum]